VLFSTFRVSSHTARKEYHRTQVVGLVSAAVLLALLVTAPASMAPGLWCALGIVIGSQLLLSGAYRLHITPPSALTPAGRSLAARQDTWFPFLLFIIRTTAFVSVAIVLWFSIQAMGFPGSALQSVNLLALVVLIPTRRMFLEAGRVRGSPRMIQLGESVQYLISFCAIAFVALFLTALVAPVYERIPTSHYTPLLWIWVPTVVGLFWCVVLFVAQVLRARSAPAQAE